MMTKNLIMKSLQRHHGMLKRLLLCTSPPDLSTRDTAAASEETDISTSTSESDLSMVDKASPQSESSAANYIC